MVPPTTSRSTRKLSEVARHVVIPSGVVSTGWPAVEKRCSEFGDEFDEWQRGVGKLVLGKRSNGDYAATVGGITLSIPRQVAKTFLIGRIVFALCTLFPGLTVLWTAHRTRTTSKTFGSLKGFASRKTVSPYVRSIRSANGEQEIHFSNGSVIMFGAREGGFGRGFEEVDVEVFDEAQILGEKALEDMVAATNQSRHPHGALLFFMGTPPRPVDLLKGDVFKLRRDDALEVVDARLSGQDVEFDAVYVECSADPDADPDDRDQWAIANPSFPDRTPLRSMLRLRKNLQSEESWLREALGIWDDPRAAGPIPGSKWASAAGVDDPLHAPAIGVDLRTGARQSLAIGVASIRSDETDDLDLAVYEMGADEQWARDFAVMEVKRIMEQHDILRVAVDQYGDGNGLLIAQLEEAGVKVQKLNTIDMRNGAVGLVSAVVNGLVKHHNDEDLNASVAGAVTRRSGDGFLWDQSRATADLTPLRALTAAWWSLQLARSADYDISASYF